jgi:hypothetical protein
MAATGLLGINPYQKGVALDFSSKPVNLGIQLEQREAAKREAVDKYFMDYEKSLNPAGMRTIDQDAFLKKLSETKQYYLKNRDQILNPAKYGAEAQSQLMSGYKDILSTIDKSKQRAADDRVLAPLVIDARKNNRTVPSDVLDALERNKLSIADPNHIDFDPLSFDAYDKHDPFKYQQGIYSKIKPSESMPERMYDPKTHEIIYKTVNDISNKSFGEIQNVVSSELQKDRGLIDNVRAIARDQNKLDQLAKVYKDFSGKQMNPNSLQDVATAYTIALKPEAQVKYTTPREDAEYRRRQSMYDQEALYDYKEKNKLKDVGAGSSSVLVNLVSEAQKTPKVIYNKDTKQSETFYVVPLTKTIQSQFTTPQKVPVKNTQGEEVGQKIIQKEVDNVLFNPRTKEFVGYYQNLDKDGNPTRNFDYKILNPRDIAQNLVSGVTSVKEREAAIGSALKGLYEPSAPAAKATTEVFTYKGKKYSQAQLDKAAKSSGMSVDEYIKALK